MIKHLKQRWFAVLSPAILVAWDAGLTLLGQPKAYWADHSVTNEFAPMFNSALQTSPWAFVAVTILWTCGIALLVLILPRYFALLVSVSFTTGHAAAASGWMLYHFNFGYWSLYWYHPLVSALIVASCTYTLQHETPSAWTE